jgi:hypothetical protein
MVNVPSSSLTGGQSSCRTGPSGRCSRTGTLRTTYAPSLSGSVLLGSVDGGRVCAEAEDEGTFGGDCGLAGAAVGVTFAATLQ